MHKTFVDDSIKYQFLWWWLYLKLQTIQNVSDVMEAVKIHNFQVKLNKRKKGAIVLHNVITGHAKLHNSKIQFSIMFL